MFDNIKVLDENKKFIADIPASAFYEYDYHLYLETGAESLEFNTILNSRLAEVFAEKKFIYFTFNDKHKLFQIVKCKDKETAENIERRVFTQFVGLELANTYVRACTIEGNAKKYLTTILQDSNYSVGYVSPILDIDVQNTVIKEPTNCYTLVQNMRKIYVNCEVEFDLEIIDSISGKYKFTINVYADGERGNRTYKRFDYDFNTYGITRDTDCTEFYSGLIGVGKNGLTFADISWDEVEGAPLSKPLGQDFLLDPEAHAMFSNGDKYILGKFTSDANDPATLLWETFNKLQEMKQIKIDYDVPVEMPDDEYKSLNMGDTVHIVNDKFEPALQLEARIFELQFTSSGNKIKFSNYKSVESKIKNVNEVYTDILESVENSTKLTESDILALEKILMDLDIQEEEIKDIIKNILDNLEDGVEIEPQPGDEELEEIDPAIDTENYKTVKLSTTDKGLWLGDKRIYDIKKNNVADVIIKTTETVKDTVSSKAAQQYKDAYQYYKGFAIGNYSKKTSLTNLISNNNKYKIPTIVRYWSKKFGVDPYLVYAMIIAESSGNPNCAVGSNAGYGLMQCERSVYFGRKQTIKFLNGTTKSFTPSYNTMRPGSGGKTTINGVKVDKNISNQIMFGIHELRQRADDCNYNIFATLMGYNFGMGGVYWCTCHYIKDKYGYSLYGTNSYRGLSKQSSKVKQKYYDILDTHKAPFASYRQRYRNQFREGTPTNIEYYLRWYKIVNGQLPYFLDKKGNKIGYGVNTVSSSVQVNKEETGLEVRNKIVKMAKTIVSQHVDKKIATYNQSPRTYRFDKPKIWHGTHYGIKNPIAYDCSSFVSCCYHSVGLTSVLNKSCAAGTLVDSATSKSGWKAWKVTTDGIKQAKPGDIVMVSKYSIDSSKVASNPNRYSTYHTLIYIGDNKVAHASKWTYHPKAIKISDIDYYRKLGKAFFLRPWDLVAADKKVSTSTSDEDIVISKDVIVEKTITEVTLKGIPDATPADYIDTAEITINNIEDDVAYPKTSPYIFLHFGINDLTTQGVQDYQDLIKSLFTKYPKRPVFIAKEFNVNRSYANYESVNEDINAFNSQMQDYCNKTRYAIFLDVSNSLVDSNGQILSTLSANGYSFKDKESINKYYNNVKKAILNISKGQIIESTSTSINLTAQPQKIYEYNKGIKSFKLKLPNEVVESYYTRIVFSTDSSSIKFSQPSGLYLNGDNCKNGAFTPRKATKYIINIFASVEDGYKYQGSVTAVHTVVKTGKQEGYINNPSGNKTVNVRKGASTKYKILGKLVDNTKISIISKTSNNWYKIRYKNSYGYVSGKLVDNIKNVTEYTTDFTDYNKFAYGNDLVAYAKTYLDNVKKLTYNNTTPLDFSKPLDNISSWTTNGKYHIDDSSFTSYILMGWNFNGSHYGNQKDRNNRDKRSNCCWALPYLYSEAKIAKYFVEQDWILDDVDLDKYTNLYPGDIFFYDVDGTLTNVYAGVSHTAIYIGNGYLIEATTGDVIRKVSVAERGINNLIFIGRINKK